MMKTLVCMLAAVILSWTSDLLAAENENESAPIGVVIAYLGEIKSLDAAEQERTLEYGSGVSINDVVGVSENSKLQILLTDGTLMSVAAGTIFRITDYVYEDSTNDTLKVEIIEGTIRMLSGEIDKKENPGIQVLTPEGNVSVEGTLFSTHTSKDGTAVGFFRGSGSLSTETGAVSLGKGKGFDFSFVPAGDTSLPRGQLGEPQLLASLERQGTLSIPTPTPVTPALKANLKIRPVTASTISDIKTRIRIGGRFAERARIQLRDRQVNLHADGIDCKCTKRK